MDDNSKLVPLLSHEDLKSEEDDPPLVTSRHHGTSPDLPEDDIQTIIQKIRMIFVYLRILFGYFIDVVIGMSAYSIGFERIFGIIFCKFNQC